MTLSKLASYITLTEGKKHQASIGDVREILKIIISRVAAEEMVSGTSETLDLIYAEVDWLILKKVGQKKKAKKKKVSKK